MPSINYVMDLEEEIKNLRTKIKIMGEQNEDLKSKLDTDLAFCRIKQLEDANNVLEKEINELKKQNYTLGEKCQKETRIRENWKQMCHEQNKRIWDLMKKKQELQQQLDTLTRKDAVFVDLDSSKLKGMEELWAMLGTMYAADPIEVTKIFGWFSINSIAHYTPDVKEFLKKYETWKSGKDEKEAERKRLDYMRDYLHRFCLGKVCYGCPLNTPEFKCCGHGGFDSISDEDLKRYYEKARGCGRFPWTDKKEEKPSDEVPCSFGWKLDGTEFSIETSIPRKDYGNIVKIISGKE